MASTAATFIFLIFRIRKVTILFDSLDGNSAVAGILQMFYAIFQTAHKLNLHLHLDGNMAIVDVRLISYLYYLRTF